jgi:hypothetical protein
MRLITTLASATAATIATATAAAAVSTTTTAPAVPSAAGTFFAWARFIDRQRTTFQRFTVELIDRVLCVCFTRHCDESEAAGFAGEFVLHEHHFADSARLSKQILKIRLSGVEREIPDVEFGAHWLVFFFSFPLSEDCGDGSRLSDFKSSLKLTH